MEDNIIARNGELIVAIVAAFIALVGLAAHVGEPIERAASHATPRTLRGE